MGAGKQWCCQMSKYFLPHAVPLALHVVSPICSRESWEKQRLLCQLHILHNLCLDQKEV